MYLEERCAEKYTDMEACNLGGNLFNFAHPTSPFTTTCSFFGSPSQCMEFHCGDNKMKKIYIIKKKKKEKKQQMYNWSFVSLTYCVSFLTIHGV